MAKQLGPSKVNSDNLADIKDKFDKSNLLRTAIFKVSSDRKILKNESGVFLLNPASFSENKKSNWVEHNIPGQSEPTYQWVSGGPRIITFEALVTKETSYFSKFQNKQKNAFQSIIPTITGNIGAKLIYKGENIEIGQIFSKKSKAIKETISTPSMDISEELNFYRSLLYPEYIYGDKTKSNLSQLYLSPPLVVLFFGTSINTRKLGDFIGSKFQDVWIVTDLNINVNKFLPNMSPMEASVKFTLKQYSLGSIGESKFTNNSRIFNK